MQGQPMQYGASGGLAGQGSAGQGFNSNAGMMGQNPYIWMNQSQETRPDESDPNNNDKNGGKKGAEAEPKKKGVCPFRNGEWKAPWQKK